MIRQLLISLALFVVVAHGTIPHAVGNSDECSFSSASLDIDIWDALAEPMRILPEAQHPGLCLHEEATDLGSFQTFVFDQIVLPIFFVFPTTIEESQKVVFHVVDDQAFGKWRNRPPPTTA